MSPVPAVPRIFRILTLNPLLIAHKAADAAILPVTAPAQVNSGQQVVEAQALIGRVLPKHRDRFRCEIIAADHGRDVFEI